MDASLQKINDLLFAHGDIQASPREVIALNQTSPTLFTSDLEQSGATSGYQVLLTGYSNHVLRKEARLAEHYRFLDTALRQLRSSPRPDHGHVLKGSLDTRSIKNKFYRVDYRVASGQVLVFNIQPTSRIQRNRDAQERIALYRVKKNRDGIWRVGNPVQSATSPHAAVNGQSNNLVKATWLMGNHLEVAYGNSVSEYTLVHNPSNGGPNDTWESMRDKLGFTTEVSKRLAQTLSDSQAEKREISWVAHSQGGIIFAESVRYLLNGGSSTALSGLKLNGLRHPEKGELLDKHSVTLHGSGSNSWRSRRLFDRAGVKVVAIRAHDYDMVHQIVGMNTLNPRKLLGSAVYSNHVFNGSVSQSPHTTLQSRESWEHNMQEGPGRGRGPIQSAFHKIDQRATKAAKIIKNYLP